MKKGYRIFAILLLVIFLSGCGAKKEEKTCTVVEDGQYTQTIKLYATNDKIEKLDMTMDFDNAMFAEIIPGFESFEDIDDSIKTQIKDNMLTNIGLEKYEYEGLSVKIDITDKMVLTLSADIDKADPEIMAKVGLDFTDVDRSLTNAIKSFEEENGSCK